MTTVEILTALSIGPIFRLKTSKRVFAHPKFQKMQLAMSYKGNYASYRKILRKCPGAAFVPYFGLIFKDVYGLEGSKPSIKTKDEATKVTKVLFEKCLKISSYINEVCEHKRNQYDSSCYIGICTCICTMHQCTQHTHHCWIGEHVRSLAHRCA